MRRKSAFFIPPFEQVNLETCCPEDRGERAIVVDDFVARRRVIDRTGSTNLYQSLVIRIWEEAVGHRAAHVSARNKKLEAIPCRNQGIFRRKMFPDVLGKDGLNSADRSELLPIASKHEIQFFLLGLNPSRIELG